MKSIQAVVHDQREYLGQLTLGGLEIPLSATSVGGIDNHPPVGTYRLEKIVNVPLENRVAINAYGFSILYFRNTESGKLIALHGGDNDEKGELFPTEGGLRVENGDLDRLLDEIGSDSDVELLIREAHVGFFQKLRARRVSEETYTPAYRNIDDGNLTDDIFFWSELFNQNNSNAQVGDSPQDPPFEGFQGGGSGGAGASGSFEDSVVNDQSSVSSDLSQQPLQSDPLPYIAEPFAPATSDSNPVQAEADDPQASGGFHNSVSEYVPDSSDNTASDNSGSGTPY
jgi:hypothetical protein